MQRASLFVKSSISHQIRSLSTLFSLKEPNGPRVVTSEIPGPLAKGLKGISIYFIIQVLNVK